MTTMRSVEEMQAVYDKRQQQGHENEPYVLEYETHGVLLICFGARHSNDPSDRQWRDLDARWQHFVDHSNQKKVVLYERSGLNVESLTRGDALKKYGESGLIVWLAAQADITSECPEPDLGREVSYLRNKGYTDSDIMTYYFGRQMHQWGTRDYRNQPDWKAYAEDIISRYDSLGCWEESLALSQILRWFKQITGNDFDPNDRAALYVLSDPAQSRISAESGKFRDRKLLKTLEAYWSDRSDVFVVYGSGHAIVLEPVIEKLVMAKDQSPS